jgi:hypothetical protein
MTLGTSVAVVEEVEEGDGAIVADGEAGAVSVAVRIIVAVLLAVAVGTRAVAVAAAAMIVAASVGSIPLVTSNATAVCKRGSN